MCVHMREEHRKESTPLKYNFSNLLTENTLQEVNKKGQTLCFEDAGDRGSVKLGRLGQILRTENKR